MSCSPHTKYSVGTPQQKPGSALRVHESSSISTATSFTYVGVADPGILDADNKWRVFRVEETGSLTLLKQADGDDNFDNIWNDRLTLTYI